MEDFKPYEPVPEKVGLDPEESAQERERKENESIEKIVEDFFSERDRSTKIENISDNELLEAITEKAGDIALGIIRNKYENPANQEQFLAFHNTEHTEGVVRRIKQLATAITRVKPEFGNKEIAEAQLEGYFHDADHLFEKKDGVRKRITGRGEDYSAHRLTFFKQRVNEELKKRNKPEIFAIDKDKDERAIAVTKPSFLPGVGVVQQELKPETPLESRLLALADLADFGMDGPDAVIRAGKKLSIEENSDVVEALRSGRELSPEEKEIFKKKLLGLIKGQGNFVKSRKDRFEADLEGVTDESVRSAIRDQFKYFKDSDFEQALQRVNEEVTRITNLDFDALVEELTIPESLNESSR